jgi:RimJ/RimL family protein N-acetyltransferase
MQFFADGLTLRTRQLLLRRLRLDDAEALFKLFNNWNVVRFLSSPPWPYLPEDSRLFAGAVAGRSRELDEDALAITHDGAFVGIIGVRQREANNLQRGAGPNIGYWIGEPFWGRGFMTEAVDAVVQHLFATTQTDAIYCGAFTDNAASLRVQDKCGFVRDGDTTLFSTPRGVELPHVNTVLTRARFGRLPLR